MKGDILDGYRFRRTFTMYGYERHMFITNIKIKNFCIEVHPLSSGLRADLAPQVV